MARQISPGFFKQEHVHHLMTCSTLSQARSYVDNIVDEFTRAHPTVKPENVQKVHAFVMKARSPLDLAKSVQNFILAHPSEGLKVI
jgi:hypothetical protein